MIEILIWIFGLAFAALIVFAAGEFMYHGGHDEDENGDINRDL